MRFSLQQDFPFGIDALWPVYGAPAYLEAKYKALGAHSLRIQVAETTDEEIRVVLERTIAPDLRGVPDWARKMLGAEYVMRHENHCRRTGTAAQVHLRITPAGAPVTIEARGQLGDRGERAHLALEFQVECSIPLVGKKVAELFAAKIREALAEDYDFTRDYVGRLI